MVTLTGKASDFLKIAVAAAGRGDLATVRTVLAEQPQWVRRVGSHGRTMLWEAAYRGRLAMVEHLLAQGADINACGCHFTPLLVDVSAYCAARHKGHRAVADLLRRRGARVDFHTHVFLGDHRTVAAALLRQPELANAEKPQHDANIRAGPLHYAVSPGHADLVAQLLAHGADPRPHSHWLTRFCIWRGRADILAALLAAGLEPSQAAVPRAGIANPAIVELLRSRGVAANPDHAEGGWPPIVFHSRGDRGGDVERIRRLIAAGADVNARNHKGQTALHCAAKAGFGEIAALLIEHGAELDTRDRQGQTPLLAALRSTAKHKGKLRAMVRLLSAAGASPEQADERGRTPLAVAAAKRDAAFWLEALEAQTRPRPAGRA